MAAHCCAQNTGELQKPAPVYVDYDKKFSRTAHRRIMPELRKAAVYMLQDNYIKMAGGFPNPEMFPLIEADFKLRDGSVVHVDQKLMVTTSQYGMSEGYPELREWMIEFQQRMHSPPTLDPEHPGHFDLIIVNGSNEGINLAFDLFVDEGDWVLAEEFTYPTVVSMMSALGAELHGIRTDVEGMVPEDLERVLASWGHLHPGCRKPKLLYAITSGGNPTGITWSLARRRAVYDVARSHDLIILEDDAYYFLQFNRPLLPSLLSMDVDGRVVRCDTFSKLVAPGLRVAVVCGPAPALQKMRLHKDVASLTPSGLAQAMLVQLLRHWGHDGLIRHVDSVMEFYKGRTQQVVRCAEKHLSGLADWTAPSGGMFLWMRVLGVKDSKVIVEKALERRVICVNGTCFSPTNQDSAYIRFSCATVSQEDCAKAFSILADVIKEELAKER